jgi:hypothetical protein
VAGEYFVGLENSHAQVRLVRRGGWGKQKKLRIFARDGEAKEGEDYFCNDNSFGELVFGPSERYKDIQILLTKNRVREKSFILELADEEGFDLGRKYESQIVILGGSLLHDETEYDFGDLSTDDEQLDQQNFLDELEANDFKVFKNAVLAEKNKIPFEIENMKFEKREYNFWHDQGIISIPIVCDDNTTWNTVDSDISAVSGRDYEGVSTESVDKFNKFIEIEIHEGENHQPVVFAIQMKNKNKIVQTNIILRPPPKSRTININ